MLLSVTAIAVMLGIMSLTPNRLIRRRLRLSIALLIAYLAVDATLRIYGFRHFATDTQSELTAFDRLAFAAAFINAFVFLLVNPLRADRVPERFPIILQDFIVLALILLASTFLSQQLLTTSAVSAVVLGFALQDTLGNAFAGLAIQSEKPFHVGQWIKIGENEGRVAEVTWRATKLRTKSGNFAVIPNNIIAKEVITNFSEPAAPTRMTVDVGASYLAPPNQVKAVLMDAMRHSSYVLAAPAPDVLMWSFDASAITYRARFWIEDYDDDDRAKDEVRRAIYYGFQRHGIEIPWPIQVQYEKEWREPDSSGKVDAQERLLASVDLFASLAPELRHEIAAASQATVYGSGEAIVRQGEEGQSMFVVMSGSVSVVVEPSRDEVARIQPGGYFGEMSLLTGEPRSATVLAVGDVVVVEIGAELFRRMGAVHPDAIEKIGIAAMVRRAGLEKVKTATSVTVAAETANLLTRMKRFLGLA